MKTPKKTNEAKINTIRGKIRNGYSPTHGYLHIPKTGGSGVSVYGQELVSRGHAFPVVFPHGWTVREIREHFPKMRISFILRDPLDRMISGFNSRLRQGRPTYNIVWTPGEAAAFSLLPSVRHWLDALLSEDEFQTSAANFVMRAVNHLNWNYSFYFEGARSAQEFSSSFEAVGSIDAISPFVDHMTQIAGAPASLPAELYKKSHESSSKSSDVLAQYTSDEISRMRRVLDKEYRIYRELLKFSNVSTG